MTDLSSPVLLRASYGAVVDSVWYHLTRIDRRFSPSREDGTGDASTHFLLRFSTTGSSWIYGESELATIRVRAISVDETSLRFDESRWCVASVEDAMSQWTHSGKPTALEAERRLSAFRYASTVAQRRLINGLNEDHITLVTHGDGLEKPRGKTSFVAPRRLNDLRASSSQEFDLSRMIRLCEEINACYENGCYSAVAILARAVLDHVPPVFGVADFHQVANNIVTGSLKKSLATLDRTARNIADDTLHRHIRRKEVVPTQATVAFAAEFDVLLAEITRRLADNTTERNP